MTREMLLVCPECDGTNHVSPERTNVHAKCNLCHRPLFPGQPLELNSVRFTEHALRSELPLVVEFWADWCDPCRGMADVVRRAAGILEPLARMARVDTGQEQELAERWRIRGVPTLVLIRRGTELARRSGALELDALIRWTRQHLE